MISNLLLKNSNNLISKSPLNPIKIAQRAYITEIEDWVTGIENGSIKGVDPNTNRRCIVCNQILHGIQHNAPNPVGLPKVCNLSSKWEKEWLMYHDSFHTPNRTDNYTLSRIRDYGKPGQLKDVSEEVNECLEHIDSSLDGSDEDIYSDELLQEYSQSCVIATDLPSEKRKVRCGPHCCDD